MRIAFYAPMKPPDHPVPSGDREMARHLWDGLELAGFSPMLASRFSAFDPLGDAGQQRQLAAAGQSIAATVLRQMRQLPPAERPRLWFTYHLYYKAPDWLGPRVADALDIPYVVAEASHAGKRATGRWAMPHRAAAMAIAAADLVFSPNPDDDESIRPLLAEPERLIPLPPAIDVAPYAAAAAARAAHRRRLAKTHHVDPDQPWLVSAAMMRPGAKLASYRLLADALDRIVDRPWHLLVAGDGSAADAVRAAFAPLAQRVTWLGEVAHSAMPGVLAAADLCVWPAVDEAYGVTLIEAQAAGLPVIAGARPGVAGIVADGETGRLVPTGDAAAFTASIASLLDAPKDRATLAAGAAARARQHHHLDTTAALFRRHLPPLVERHARATRSAAACPAA